MLRVSRGVGQISCFLPLVGRAAHIPKVFSSENCVAVSALLDHGVLRQFLIEGEKRARATRPYGGWVMGLLGFLFSRGLWVGDIG
jgi:hypothetical protein